MLVGLVLPRLLLLFLSLSHLLMAITNFSVVPILLFKVLKWHRLVSHALLPDLFAIQLARACFEDIVSSYLWPTNYIICSFF